MEACERSCCDEPLCHSTVWHGRNGSCTASLALAHGARPTDWCWHPTAVADAITSIRLPGEWQERAVSEARRVLDAPAVLRVGGSSGPRYFVKPWRSAKHYGIAGHTKVLEGCSAPTGSRHVQVSPLVADAMPTQELRVRRSQLACNF